MSEALENSVTNLGFPKTLHTREGTISSIFGLTYWVLYGILLERIQGDKPVKYPKLKHWAC